MKILEIAPLWLYEDIEGPKANRAEFIKQRIGNKWRGLPGYKDLDALLEKLAAVDPSRNGVYMPWMAQMLISNPNQNRAEDLDRVGGDLQMFERFKSRIQNKDINSYRSFDELYNVIEPLQTQSAVDPDKEAHKAEIERIKADIETVYSGPEGWIRIPKTEEAACFLGQNTRWCTASKRSNMFHYYAKDDWLFIIYDKDTKKRTQLHISSNQFADEADRNQGLKTLPEWARPPILAYYTKNKENLSFKQMMGVSSMGGENLAKGTKHEALLDLMAQYGV